MPSASSVVVARNDTSSDPRQHEATALAAAAFEQRPQSAHVGMLNRIAVAVRRALEASHYDSSFERPDLIEDDYFRFRNQPRD